jgi:chromosome segregation ATPase
MNITATSDPYYVARDAVNQSANEIQILFKAWEGALMSDQTGAKSFAELTRSLLDDVDRLEEDLSVIDNSIKVVESNPQRFPLRSGEIETRKQWARTQHRLCSDIRSKANGSQAKAKIESERKKAAALAAEQARQKRLAEEANTNSIKTTQQVHEQIINQQDDTLAELARVTDRLGQTAVVINTELQDQQRLLNELDNDLDRQQEKMNYVMGKMAKLLKTNDTKQLIFVLVLLVIAVVLFMMNISV